MSVRVVRPLATAALVAVLLALTTACNIFQPAAGSPNLELDYSQTLPDNWEPIDTWQEVNIDGDDATEYLLLYTFDQSLVGGAIYDTQISPDLVGVVEVSATPVTTPTIALVPVPLQPLAYYRPYRLLPASWSYAYGGNVGHGYFSDSGDIENIAVKQVGGQTVDDQAEDDQTAVATEDTASDTQPPSELVIYADGTHLTFVWWLNEVQGYATTQLNAPGGFPDLNWEGWSGSASPDPITEVSGLEPLTDYRARSQLCRETQYTRVDDATNDTASDADTPTIEFASEDLGLTFCTDWADSDPYYPEGVVMKYLEVANAMAQGEADIEQLADLVTPEIGVESIERGAEIVDLDAEMISDISAYPTVPALAPRIVTGDFLPTTTVCVEATPRDASGSPRWIVYTLRYQPPDYTPPEHTADRWTISGAEEMPKLAENQPPYQCEMLLTATLD